MWKGSTNLSIDFSDLETQPRMIDAKQGSENQDVNINDVFLFFTIRRGLFYTRIQESFF